MNDRLKQFSAYVADAARAAGYDIDSPRGGGKKALAKAAAMSQPSVSRMLAGQSFPDPKVLERIADALGVSLPTLLVASGVVRRGSAIGAADDADQSPVTSAVVARLRLHRQAQKVSAQSLADRMTELGYPIQRSVIANIESGRRAEVSVDFLTFAAQALGIDAPTVLRTVTSPCPTCKGAPPQGFTCNTCGGVS